MIFRRNFVYQKYHQPSSKEGCSFG